MHGLFDQSRKSGGKIGIYRYLMHQTWQILAFQHYLCQTAYDTYQAHILFPIVTRTGINPVYFYPYSQ